MDKFGSIAVALVFFLASITPAVAEQDFGFCLVCHGSGAGGNQAIGGPNLTGLAPWYMKGQFNAFANGYRGWHADDEQGRSMAAAARALSDEVDVDAAVAFIAAYPFVPAAPTLDGDAERGRVLYATCAACHGADGAGNDMLQAPALAGQNDWYMKKTLDDYRVGYRGTSPEDQYGATMRLAATQLPDDQAVYDVLAYINSFKSDAVAPVVAPAGFSNSSSSNNAVSQTKESDPMKKQSSKTGLRAALPAVALAVASTSVLAHDVTRYPLPNGSTFPIAQAVTVPAGTELTFHSGLLPAPADPDAEPGTRAFLGDTYTQTMSVLQQFEASLAAKGMGLGNIIKMNVFLVGDPELGDKMDFAGFMRAYSQFFGTEEQPHLPARAAVQIAGLARGAFIEIEVIAAR